MTWTEMRMVRGLVARHTLAMAFALSLVVHLTFYGGWKLGKHLGWWEHQATWLMDLKKKLNPKPLQPVFARGAVVPPAQREIPLTFVEVDPSVARHEPPKETKYYGAQNSVAANPEPTVDTAAPKADGNQTKMVRVEDVPKPNPAPLQPAMSPEKTQEPAQPKPKGGESPGDLAKARPEELKKPSDGHADLGLGQADAVQRERPRTLAAARQKNQSLAGEKMRQEGGIKERGKFALDVARTPFGSYDAALVAAVQQRWYDLLDSTPFAQRTGKVTLEFRLYYDGRVTDMKVDGNEVGEILGLLCQRAIQDPSPFAVWPSDMRRAIGKNYRDVQFTFYYN